jgi:UDP-glucose 4-epimerase
MKNILLTGATGFIGNYFIKKYQKQYNIKTFSFRNNDFNALDLSSINVIIHLSALVHQMGGANSEEYEKINVEQTIRLAEKAKTSGVEHFVFMSSIAVYGIEFGLIKIDSECRPITEYAKTKLRAEKLLESFSDNLKISIVRPPIVNGCSCPGNMKSLISLVKKLPIIPFNKINNKRSMVYIGNLCHLMNEIITQNKSGIFLAADDESISTTHLIELISKNLNKKTYLIKIPFFASLLKLVKPSFHKRLFGSLEVDNLKTKELLNLTNPYCVEKGIELMIKGEEFV